jgi:phospholipase C
MSALLKWAILASVVHAAAIPSSTSWKDAIQNVVVLVQENRSFDTFLGGLTYNSSIDGVLTTKYCNPLDLNDPNSVNVCAQPTGQNIAQDDPNHGISGGNMQIYGTYHPDEDAIKAGTVTAMMKGFVSEQKSMYRTGNDIDRAAEVIEYYTPAHIPVFSSLAENFLVFDRWFASVPGPTNPNRAYLTSGTSHGHGFNDVDFDISALPQRSIFQQLTEKGISWINYSNTTRSGFLPDALFYRWTVASGHASGQVRDIDEFYADAEAGTLPQLTYINPECCTYQSFHPSSPIDLGESFVKGIYEALRSSPQWNTTLFILTFDEHGGFADHVPPPINVPPGDSLLYTEFAPDAKPITFDFTRLGMRVPTLLISPWVPKGAVENMPPPEQVGEYTHTSIPAFLAKMWDLDILTNRVGWSATFEHLIRTEEMRIDTPVTLPEPVLWRL